MGDQLGFLKMLLGLIRPSDCDFEAYVSGSFSFLSSKHFQICGEILSDYVYFINLSRFCSMILAVSGPFMNWSAL